MVKNSLRRRAINLKKKEVFKKPLDVEENETDLTDEVKNTARKVDKVGKQSLLTQILHLLKK